MSEPPRLLVVVNERAGMREAIARELPHVPFRFLAEAAPADAGNVEAALLGSMGRDAARWEPAAFPRLRFIQRAFTGVDDLPFDRLPPGVEVAGNVGAYAPFVAEHALALALGGLRQLKVRARATSWGKQKGATLYGAPVTLLGGGGITLELLELLAPFHVEATVVRRSAAPVPGAARTVPPSGLHEALAPALVVFVALALVPDTINFISAPELSVMRPDAWLVNVGRGRHVDTPALVEALQTGGIGGAALDVTEPEPLPEGHPLWDLPNCLITPHTANTAEMSAPLLAERVQDNVSRLAHGLPLVGTVDTVAGY